MARDTRASIMTAAALLVLLLMPCAGYSQDEELPTFEHLNAAQRQQAEALRGEIQAKVDAYMDDVRRGQESVPADLPQGVYKHLRGTGGVTLPRKEEIGIEKLLDGIRQELKPKVKEAVASSASFPEPPAPLKRCRDSGTERSETGVTEFRSEKEEKATYADTLFVLREDLVPLDEKPFGAAVRVLAIASDGDDASLRFAHQVGVPCVPFRIRTTGRFSFHDRGVNALKDYDRDPWGEGFVSAVVAAKYGLPYEKREGEGVNE